MQQLLKKVVHVDYKEEDNDDDDGERNARRSHFRLRHFTIDPRRR